MRSQLGLNRRDRLDSSGYDGGTQGKYPFGYYGGATPAAVTNGAASPTPAGGVLTTAITFAGGPNNAQTTAATTLITNVETVTVASVVIPVGQNAAQAAIDVANAINSAGPTDLVASAASGVLTLTGSGTVTGITTFSISIS